MPRVVVLGTGTAVGKTHVTAALARALAHHQPGAAVGALKPVETGVVPGAPSDARTLAEASTAGVLPATTALYAFADPVTPHLAAQRAGRSLELGRIRAHIEDWERSNNVASRSVWSVIETAGGTLSPLSGSATNFELATALEPALWVLVAPDALGVLHDVSATWAALRARGREPDFLVLSAAREPDASTGTNAAVLEELGIARPVAVLGRGETELSALAEALIRSAQD